MTGSSIVDEHYKAYADNDLEGLLATLREDYTVAPLNGQPWLTSKDGARKVYARHLRDYPLHLTDVLGRIDMGPVVIKREHSRPAPGTDAPAADVMPIYSLRDGLMARCDTVQRTGGDEAANVAVAEAQLAAYNAQDLDAHIAHFSDDIVVADLNGAENLHGLAAYRARYEGLFAEFPRNHAELVNRLACGNVVCDHERVRRSPDHPPFEVIAIYTFKDGKIVRADFVK